MARQKTTGARPKTPRRQPKNAAVEPQISATAYFEAVKFALDHIADAGALGERSPLAAPYFLGAALDGVPEADTPRGRGKVLGQLLTNAVEALNPVLRGVIQPYYLHPKQRRGENRAKAIEATLGYSKATVMRYLRDGIGAVASHLSQTVLPPLRTEWPGRRTVIGRHVLINTLMAQLAHSECATLTGNSGMGKTSVGYAVAEQWGRERVLWFTLRTELNDRLLSLVFTLGYFLRNLGAGRTWQQLVADEGKLGDDALISSLIREDLATLKAREALPLICIDELEILRNELQEHTRIRHFVEGLRGQVPLLLIGQRVVVDTLDVHNCHNLSGLSVDELNDLLVHEGVFYLSDSDKVQVQRITRGNPALVRMFAMLHRSGENVASVFGRMGTEATAEALLNRIWSKLEGNERRLLGALAVFHGYAPRDAWEQAEAQVAIGQLVGRGLVDDDERGGIAVAPFAREFVLRQVSADARQTAHWAAAKVREQRGEFALAVGHYIAANQPTIAVRLWAPHRHAERARGYGPLVMTQLRSVPLSQLESDEDRRALAVMLSEQLYTDGAGEAMLETLGLVNWPDEYPLTPIAHGLMGDAYQLVGSIDQASSAYAAGLKALEQPFETTRVNLLRHLGHVHTYHNRDLALARIEAMQARFEVEALAGSLEEESGNYDLARGHYMSALAAVEKIPNNTRQRRDCYGELGRLAMRYGDLENAETYLAQAIKLAHNTGRTFLLIMDYINLSGVHILQKRYDKALEVALEGLQTCEQRGIKSMYHIAGLASNAGEACYYLGRYEDALGYAQHAVQAEEPAHLSYALAVIGMVRRTLGDLERADAHLVQSLQWAQQYGDHYAEASAWREIGTLYLAQGRKADARQAYENSRAIFERLGNAMETSAVAAKLAEAA